MLKSFSFRRLCAWPRLRGMTFFDGIAGLASNLIGEPIKQWQKRKTLKVEQKFQIEKLDHEANLASAKARLEMARQGQAQDYDLDRIAMKNMAASWKDELVLVIFLTPVVLAFIPGMDKYVLAGFAAIERMPEWYMAIVIGMVVVIYGLRGLLKAWLQRGFNAPLLKGSPKARGNSPPLEGCLPEQTGPHGRGGNP